MRRLTKEIRGSTLIETLIVMALSSLLIGLFLHADLTVNRSIMRWTFRSGLEQAVISLGKQLHRDVDYCDSLRMSNTGELQVFCNGVPDVIYAMHDNTLSRNGRVLLPAKVVVTELSLNPLRLHTESPSDVLKSNGQVEMVLTITVRRDDMAGQTLMLPIRPYASLHVE